MREEFRNCYDGTKLIFIDDGIEFYSKNGSDTIPYSCISKITMGVLNCVNIKTNDKKLLTFRDPDGNKERMKKMVAYAQKSMLSSKDVSPSSSQTQEIISTIEFKLTPSEENEINIHKKSIIILFTGIVCLLTGYFLPILGGIGGLIITIGFYMFFKFRSKSAIYYEKRKAKMMADNIITNVQYDLDIEVDPDATKAKLKAETKSIIKGAVVGGIIGGDAGAVVGAMVEKNKIDNKKKN